MSMSQFLPGSKLDLTRIKMTFMALHFHSSGTCAYCVGTMLEGFWVKKQHCSIDTKYNDAELNTANLSREANHSLYEFQEAEVDTLFLTLSL